MPAVACPVLPGWKTKGKKVQAERSDVGMIEDLMAAGFLPVVHGDAVLDDEQGCAILSGDAIAQRLCEALPRVHSCVFVTNVWGVFDRPPSAFCVAFCSGCCATRTRQSRDAAHDDTERKDMTHWVGG